MSKETSSFSLIIFLFIILTAWWAASSFQLPKRAPVQQIVHSTFVAPTNPIHIYHSSLKELETYSGTLDVPICDEFVTSIRAAQGSARHLQISMSISRVTPDCEANPETVRVPFTVTYRSIESVTPILESVTINNQAAAFSITEATR